MKLRTLFFTFTAIAASSAAFAQNTRSPNEGPVVPEPGGAEVEPTVEERSAIPQPPAEIPTGGEYADRPGVLELLARETDLGTFARIIDATGQNEMLEGDGPFTIFAPTNQAFAQLPEGRLDALLERENRQELAALLGRHVVRGRVTLSEAEQGPLQPLTGGQLELRPGTEGGTIASVVITRADIQGKNGVIHVVDSVLPSPAEVNPPVEVPEAEGEVIETTERIEVETVEE